jgi:hypothetical protein
MVAVKHDLSLRNLSDLGSNAEDREFKKQSQQSETLHIV